jgi:hypothetical protein
MTNGRTEWRGSDSIESGNYSQRPRRKRAEKANRPRNVIAFAIHVMGGVGACPFNPAHWIHPNLSRLPLSQRRPRRTWCWHPLVDVLLDCNRNTASAISAAILRLSSVAFTCQLDGRLWQHQRDA